MGKAFCAMVLMMVVVVMVVNSTARHFQWHEICTGFLGEIFSA